MWVQLVLLAAQYALGEITRQRPKKISFEEFNQNNAPSEIRPIPYIAGTEKIVPQRIWYGDFLARAVERDSHWLDYVFLGPGIAALLDFITVGYRYYIGDCLALCFGPDAHVDQLFVGGRIMYNANGADNAGGGFLADDPQAWGGDQPPGEGGHYVWYDITRGNYTDPTNAYLEQILSTPPNKTPALHGISLLVGRGPSGFTESGYIAAGGVGFIPRFRDYEVVVRRQPNHLQTDFHKIGTHANPMEVYFEHTTSLDYGAKCPIEEINIPSWQAAAERFHTEGLGWSGKIENPTSPLQVCKNIEAQCDMIMDPSPSLGLTARLIRRDYSFGSLPVLNRNNCKPKEYSPGTYEDTINKVIIPFGDQNNNFADRPAIYIDPANQTIQGGRIVPRTNEYVGVADYAVGNLLVTRDGRAISVPRGALPVEVLPSVGRLRYRGEVVKFEWTNPTFSLVMRIQSITKPTTDSPMYGLELIEDQFASGLRTFGEPVGTGHVDPGAGLDTAPPSASWDEVLLPPDGLEVVITIGNGGQLSTSIRGAIVFGEYSPGGQYARIWTTEPGGVQTLSPIRLAPDADNKAQFAWPVGAEGTFEFCVQTYSIKNVTNNAKVCAQIEVVFAETPPTDAVTIDGIVVTIDSEIVTGDW